MKNWLSLFLFLLPALAHGVEIKPLYLSPDGTTLERNGAQVRVKDSGISTAKIADSAVTRVKISGLTSPTVQSFFSGSGTYTKPAGVVWLRVYGVGGGGGGAGSGSSGAGSGGNGTATTFGSSFLTGNGGTGGVTNSSWGGAGGTATNSGGLAFGRTLQGAYGSAPGGLGSTYTHGGNGGSSLFGPGSIGSGSTNTSNAGPITSGSYGGGGGGAGGYAAGVFAGAGGGAGGGFDVIIPNPASSYSYSVGQSGSGGTAGVSGFTGQAGLSGAIYVEEFYQ